MEYYPLNNLYKDIVKFMVDKWLKILLSKYLKSLMLTIMVHYNIANLLLMDLEERDKNKYKNFNKLLICSIKTKVELYLGIRLEKYYKGRYRDFTSKI